MFSNWIVFQFSQGVINDRPWSRWPKWPPHSTYKWIPYLWLEKRVCRYQTIAEESLHTVSNVTHWCYIQGKIFSWVSQSSISYNNLSLTMVTVSMLTSLFSPSSVQFLRLSFMEVSIRMERSQSQILNQKYSRCFLDIFTHQYHWM